MRILDVGNCEPDHATLCTFLNRHFDCEVVRAHGPEDALGELRRAECDLVLINRKLDRDQSEGTEILKEIKADPHLTEIPVMLITNFADHQDAAIALGANRGFGKLEYDSPETLERLKAVLTPSHP